MPFIVFEGLDGSGKSSLIQGLEQHLQAHHVAYIRTHEPGGTPLGEELRQILLRNSAYAPSPRSELLLYEAIRAQHVDKVIQPALQAGKWVLCDRFSASSVAFQAGGRQIEERWVHLLNEFATCGLEPDLTVLLDLSVQEAKRRRSQRNANQKTMDDRMESEADHFHNRVRESFLNQAQKAPQKWLVLDAGLATSQLVELTLKEFKNRGWLQ